MTWFSRELPKWDVGGSRPPDEGTEEMHAEQVCNRLNADMKILQQHLTRILESLKLPRLPKSLFHMGYVSTELHINHIWCSRSDCNATNASKLQKLCDSAISVLDCAVYDRRELPQGWDMTHGWPQLPIRSVGELAVHLEQTRAELLQRFPAPLFEFVNSESEPLVPFFNDPFVNDPGKYCRQIENAHRALAFWQTPNPPKQSSSAKSIAEAESQLSGLIAWLRDYEANEEQTQDVTTPSVDLADLDGTEAPAPSVEYLLLESQILDALDGKSLKVEPLANALGVNSARFYKKPWRGDAKQHVLGYMLAQQWIRHDSKLGGYYRPGFLPPSSLPKNPPTKKNGR